MALKELNAYKIRPLFVVISVVIVALAVIIFTIIFSFLSSRNQSNQFDSGICWNKVIKYDRRGTRDTYYWPNGCKGQKSTWDTFCTQALVSLTPEEAKQYEAWRSAGSIVIFDCK